MPRHLHAFHRPKMSPWGVARRSDDQALRWSVRSRDVRHKVLSRWTPGKDLGRVLDQEPFSVAVSVTRFRLKIGNAKAVEIH